MKYRKLKDLKKLEGNPRIIRDKQFKTLCQSIKDNPQYFEARPLILSNRTGELVIIAGNQRYEAAKVLKLKQAPTFLMEELTEEKEREIIIRDNVANGEWDYAILADSWADVPLMEWGVNLPTAFQEMKQPDINSDEYNKLNYQIVIECESESHQAGLIEKLLREGIKCRPLIL